MPKCETIKLDIVATIDDIGRKIGEPAERSSFQDQALKTVSRLVDDTYKFDRRDIHGITALKKGIRDKDLASLQTDKSAKFGVLPRAVFQPKVQEVFDGLCKINQLNVKLKKK